MAVTDKIEKPCPLTATELFQGLNDQEIASIEKMTRLVSYKRGHLLYSPEEGKEVLFFLKEGSIQLYRLSPEGKKLIIATLGPNTFFGEMSLFGQGMYDTFAEVEQDSQVCVMYSEDVTRLLSTKPAVALNLLDILAKRLLETETTLEDLAFKNVRARLASLLLRMAEERKDNKIKGVTHQDLAERVAALRETVTEILGEFKTEGLVELGRREIVILDNKGLQRTANG